MPDMLEEIRSNTALLAIIVRAGYDKPGISFFTPDELSQQLAYMHHPSGKSIPPHVHNQIPRQVDYTQEVLIIRRGKIRVDFYDDTRQYLQSRILSANDVILLVSGGHGFEVLEEVEMFEVKQGPYSGDADKTRFPAISAEQLKLQE